MTNEKIMLVDVALGDDTKITTMDGANRNRIKNYTVETYSFKELAQKIFNRVENEKFTKVYVDVVGIGIGLVDELIGKFEENEYTYDPKSGSVFKKPTHGISFINGGLISGTLIGSKLTIEEEF